MRTPILLIATIFFTQFLEAVPARGLWTSIQGNSEHTGYLNIQTDLSKFRKAWELERSEHEFFYKPPLVSEKIVYFHLVHRSKNDLYPFVRAVDSASGRVLWDKEVDFNSSLFYQDGELFVQSTALYSYDGESGDLNYIVPLADGSSPHFGMCKTKDAFVAISGGEIQAITSDTLKASWQSQEEQNIAFQEPAINSFYIVETTSDGMAIYSTKTGALLGKALCNCYLNNAESTHVPVLDAKNGLVFNCFKDEDSWQQHLYAFDLKKAAVKWKVQNQFGQPAVADNFLYITSTAENGLNSFEASSGKQLWKWVIPLEEDIIKGWPGPVATKDLVFVQGLKASYALNRKTGLKVWQTDTTGDMALGTNILIIGGSAFWIR